MDARQRIAEKLLLAMDGDFLPGAGMGCDNAGDDVALNQARPKEMAHWVASVLLPDEALDFLDPAYWRRSHLRSGVTITLVDEDGARKGRWKVQETNTSNRWPTTAADRSGRCPRCNSHFCDGGRLCHP